MSLHKNCGWWKNSDCIFEFSVKSYLTNTINLSWAKILLPSVIYDILQGLIVVVENCDKTTKSAKLSPTSTIVQKYHVH